MKQAQDGIVSGGDKDDVSVTKQPKHSLESFKNGM